MNAIKTTSKNQLPIALHILAWIIIAIIPRYLISRYGNGDNHFLYQFYSNTAIYGVLFYINYLWLVPKFFFRENKAWYLLITSTIIVALYFLMWHINTNIFFDQVREQQITELMKEINKETREQLKPPIKEFKIYNYFYTSILVCGFSLGLGVLQKLSQNEKERKELEREKLNSELAFLKNQISPHFFFNTLNNIYSLIGIDSTEAQESVLKLSKLMRYLLYESEQGKSNLSDEINFMTNYADLMRLRLNEKVKLSILFPTNADNVSIPPLLFIPFIENAFKHGVSYRGESYIDIKMELRENLIYFYSKNSIGTSAHKNDGQHSGIGLENVKKRLNLLFPNSYKLNIEHADNFFAVELFLNTKIKNA